jgi:hypothetical protein
MMSRNSSGFFIDDAYGTKTATAGTAIVRVVPPRSDKRAVVWTLRYKNSTTEHTLTVMVAMANTTLTTEAASGQAVINLTAQLTATDGSVLAANDYVAVQHEDGSWDGYKVSSISGLAVTLATNLAKKVLKTSAVFMMGAPGASGDHPDRVYTLEASETMTLGGEYGVGTADKNNQPILIHVDNITAAGKLQWVSYGYVNE